MRLIIFLTLFCPLLSMCQPLSLTGKVINEQGDPIPGATITLKRPPSPNAQPQTPNDPSPSSVISHLSSDSQGEFSLTNLRLDDTIQITAVGYETKTIVYDHSYIRFPQTTVVLHRKIGLLDETVVIAYGTTTRRFSTGSVSRVSAEEIARQPVFNPLSALQGRVPGLTVAPTSGMPGSAIRLQVRGRSSLAQGSDPLIIIDGIPYAPNNNLVNQFYSAAGGFPDATTGLSPFAALNPADIQSIEVLKDADATAIYGSRGANGVILVTTKKGQEGRLSFTAAYTRGYSSLTRTLPLHNTEAYLAIRRQAFAADGVLPTATTAPDLLAWDTTRYTNLRQLFYGGAAAIHNASAALSGGNSLTRFRLSASYNKEGTVIPGSQAASRGAVHLHLDHKEGSRFSLGTSVSYTTGQTGIILSDLSSFATLPPNYPAFFTPAGDLAWQEGGVPLTNPFAYTLQRYDAHTGNLLASINLSWRLLTGVTAKLTGGYNAYTIEETALTPKASLNPYTAANPTGSSRWGSNAFRSWITEPQLHYNKVVGRLALVAVAGATLQQTASHASAVNATGYTTDGLLSSFTAAGALTATNTDSRYRYTAAFGRLSATWQGRYILNISGRRDGSSRFGPGNRFAGFGALGAAWLVHTHTWIREALPQLSFAKLRASWGTTGNDQIGNYQYLDTWSGTSRPYNAYPSLVPTRLFNPDYAWERNRKLTAALELGFCKDRILLTADYFRNRSSNQLIRYNLPAQTGFTSVLRNFPATVQNTGWEFTLNTINLTGRGWEWTTTANLTLHRNRLLAFPGIETSSYATTYVVGQPLSLRRGYHWLGVDPQTGIHQFEDANRDGVINTKDYGIIATTDPAFYGGLGNNLSRGPWSLDIFFEFKKMKGRSWEAFMPVPGTAANLPAQFTGWWQQSGDRSPYQKLTATPSTDAYKAMARYTESDAVYTDASYIRCKTVQLAYTFPAALLQKARLSAGRCFLQAQNLFLITAYRGADPEIQNTGILQPLRTLAAGISITF